MSFETVNYKFEENAATITMNRPEALNALSLQLSKDLLAAIEKAIADGARAVILTGEGRAFCSGRRFARDAGDVEKRRQN